MSSIQKNDPGRMTALYDLVFIIGVLIVLKSILLNIDAIWSYAGPIALLVALAVASWRLRSNKQTWASIGLKQPKSIFWLVRSTMVALVLTIGIGILAQSLTAGIIGTPDEATQAIDARYQGRFADIPGNLSAYLFWLSIAWIIGAFTEEMLMRGALFSRFENLFGNVPFAAVLAVTCQAVLFGQQHFYYQGLAGWVSTGAIGFLSGILYLTFNRNLWPLILSHGLSNTIGLTLIYLGIVSV